MGGALEALATRSKKQTTTAFFMGPWVPQTYEPGWIAITEGRRFWKAKQKFNSDASPTQEDDFWKQIFTLSELKGLPFGQKGQLTFAGADNSNDYLAEDLINTGKFVFTDEQLTRAKGYFTTFSDIFSTWRRFSHEGQYGSLAIPATPDDSKSWVYDAATDKIESTANTQSYTGFISLDKHSHYRHQATISSTDTDDDVIAIVIAFVEDSDNLVLNNAFGLDPALYPGLNVTDQYIPQQHTISLVRGRNTTAAFQVEGQSARYAIVYNYMRADAKLLANGDALVEHPAVLAWGGNSCDVEVVRDGDVIRTKTTNFSDAAAGKGALGYELVVNLGDFVVTERFRGAASYGYGAHSQKNTTFSNVSINVGDNIIFDIRTGTVWEADSTGAYVVNPARSLSEEIGIRRLLRNPAEESLVWVKPDGGYDVIVFGTGAGALYQIDGTPTAGSTNLVSSGGVKSYVDNKFIGFASNKEIKNIPYFYPSWWTGPRIPVYLESGFVKTHYDTDKIFETKIKRTTPYYVSPTGSNTADGLTPATAKAGVNSCIDAGAELIYMLEGVYHRDTFLGNGRELAGKDLIVIGLGDVFVTTAQKGLAWALGNSNTYSAARSSVLSVVDGKFRNAEGYRLMLTKVATLAECEAQPGSWYSDNVTVHVHTQDNRIPDADILPNLLLGQQVVSNTGRVYLKNIVLAGANLYARGVDVNCSLQLYMKHVRLPYEVRGTTGIGSNNFEINNIKLTVVQECVSGNSVRDGFNYHNTLFVPGAAAVEINCRAYNPSSNDPNNNNQCSTAHEGMAMLRIGGSYYGGKIQVIADVNAGAQSILLGCELNGELADTTTLLHAVNADVFACKFYGDKQITAEAGGAHGITLRNSRAGTLTLNGNVAIQD